jgi:hypothetical protein
MVTPLQVNSRTAEKLRELAAAQKVSVDDLLAAYVPGLSETNKSGAETDLAQAFEEWASGFPADTPPLSDESVSRASIYRDR